MKTVRKTIWIFVVIFCSNFVHGLTWAQCDPDVNYDGIVDIFDLTIAGQCSGQDPNSNPECEFADTDGDGDVDEDDLTCISKAFGQEGIGSVRVTAPDGGESLVAGTQSAINWNLNNLSGNVKIELFHGSSLDRTIISSTAHSDDGYPWKIPFDQALRSDYRVKITSLSDSNYSDMSNEFFSLLPLSCDPDVDYDGIVGEPDLVIVAKCFNKDSNINTECEVADANNDGIINIFDEVCVSKSYGQEGMGSVRVTAPDGGETLEAGAQTTVNWTSNNLSGNVKIEIFQGSSYNRTIVSSTSNDGSYSWPIASNQAARSDYRIKITSLDYPNFRDMSNGYFSIEDACLAPEKPTAIDPGSSVESSQSYTVSWNAVSNATRYIIQESTSANFSSYSSYDATDTSRSFSHTVSSYTTYYYRVAADNDPCGLTSGWSNTVDMVVNPAIVNEAEINIKQGDTSIPHGTGIFGFGSIVIDTENAVVFTVENIGDADLDLTGSQPIEIIGTNAGDFVVTNQPPTAIEPGSSATFEITFSPSGQGNRTAKVIIENNDPDENPYEFFISGEGRSEIVWYVDDGLGIDPPAEDCNGGKDWDHAFQTIKKALECASSEDEIWVKEGTYYLEEGLEVNKKVYIYGGFSGNGDERDWTSFETIIDGHQNKVQCFHVTASAAIDGFTITSGYEGPHGSGIYVYYSAAVIRNCVFTNNASWAIYLLHLRDYSHLLYTKIENCKFYDNNASAIGSFQMNYIVSNSIFYNNNAPQGAAIYNNNCVSPEIYNCTFYNNVATSAGGAIYNFDSTPYIYNSILWGGYAPNGPEIYDYRYQHDSWAHLRYSDIQGGYPAQHCIEVINQNPSFKDPENGDFHLNPDSPCIDKGDNLNGLPAADFEGDPRILDGDGDGTATVDMGADEYSSTQVLPELSVNLHSISANDGTANTVSPGTEKGTFVVGETVRITLQVLGYFLEENDVNVRGKIFVSPKENHEYIIYQSFSSVFTLNSTTPGVYISFDWPISVTELGQYDIKAELRDSSDILTYGSFDWTRGFSVVANRDGITKYFAILVGSGAKRSDRDAIQESICANDVLKMGNTLLEFGANWEPDHINELINEGVSEDAVYSKIAEIGAMMDGDDFLLFYYSGHGDTLGNLIPFEGGKIELLELDEAFLYIPPSAPKILLFDSCHSGAYVDYYNGDNGTSNMFVLSSCQANENITFHHFHILPLNSSMFSYHLRAALDGGGDANGDRQVSAEEVYDYVYLRTQVGSINQSHPQKGGYEILGELAITEEVSISSTVPTIAVNNPANYIIVAAGQIVNISWGDNDIDDNAIISLARDTDNVPAPWATGDQTWLPGALMIYEDPDGAGDRYSWDTTGVPQGTYAIWAMIYDGNHTERFARAPGLVIVGVDTDNDQLPDEWEMDHFGHLDQGPGDDNIENDGLGDGLTNLQEYQNGTDPTNPDTDSDGMPDGWEVEYELNPLADDANGDPDGDGVSNLDEYLTGRNPRKRESNKPTHYLPAILLLFD